MTLVMDGKSAGGIIYDTKDAIRKGFTGILDSGISKVSSDCTRLWAPRLVGRLLPHPYYNALNNSDISLALSLYIHTFAAAVTP